MENILFEYSHTAELAEFICFYDLDV